MSIIPYKPIFNESRQKSKKQILESAQKTIKAIQKKVKKMREEEDENTSTEVADVLDQVTSDLSDVITDVIDELGIADAAPIVDDLSQVAQSIDAQADIAEENPEIYESKIKKTAKK